MNIKERLVLSQKHEREKFGDIYTECVNKGCDLNFIKSFSNRIWFNPVLQTKCFIDHKARGKLDYFKERKVNKFEQWKIYLSTLIKLRPNDDKINEWKESLAVINYYEETGRFKDSAPFGFWIFGAGENEYTDILIKQNGENSKVINYLDNIYEAIEKNCKGTEKRIIEIRNKLANNGFSEQIMKCDKEFIKRYKP